MSCEEGQATESISSKRDFISISKQKHMLSKTQTFKTIEIIY